LLVLLNEELFELLDLAGKLADVFAILVNLLGIFFRDLLV
jgi:hypothetical protein